MDRKQIADELMKGCPEESRTDHAQIALAIRAGQPWEVLSQMEQLNRWPETYTWLKSEMAGGDNNA